MPQNTTPNTPITPLVNLQNGQPTREWWKFFNSLSTSTNQAGAGNVTTAPGSGLAGGGAVANGVSLSIAANGVTNGMIRQSAGTSVIGRFPASTGNVSDIQAVANGTVLSRKANQLVFTPDIEVTSVRTDSLRIDQAPVAEVVVCTHTITISVNGVDYKIPCAAA